ncbi:hypothetical protein H5410_015339 [Solanum commersonii]|uniref:Uncharacterized protein n=1 Tax=Solanum commersonii TaxID=4109 RepID=A0A9J5ZTU0_SOLCO|nr:hypothetical protein H5410_015339 [Solanum commersonii]
MSTQYLAKLDSAIHRHSFLVLFSPFCSVLHLSVHASGASNSATQDEIMNAHNKTQFTYAKIICVLKDSNCDTPLPKILMLAILATCASSSSTKVSKFPHVKNDSIITHKYESI